MGTEQKTTWQSYEQVAGYLLGKIGDMLGLEHVEGKQHLVGQSGATWEVDGKGVRLGSEAFVTIECRRYTKSRINQSDTVAVWGIAEDVGASGSIIVSPLGLQKGAKLFAESKGIMEVHLDENCTRLEYVLGFLNHVVHGVTDTISIADQATVIVVSDAGDQD